LSVIHRAHKAGLGCLTCLNRDRVGKPVFPVEERSVPRSDVPGRTKHSSPTQTFSENTPDGTPPPPPRGKACPPTEKDEAGDRRPKTPPRIATLYDQASLRNEGFLPPSLQARYGAATSRRQTWSGYAFEAAAQLLEPTPTTSFAWGQTNFPFKVMTCLGPPPRMASIGDQTGRLWPHRAISSVTSDLPVVLHHGARLSAVTNDLKEKSRWQIPLGSMRGVCAVRITCPAIPPGSIA